MIRGGLPMTNTRLSLVIFPVAGLCSGICSGISVIIPPLSIIAPGIFFGLALAHSLHASVTRLTPSQQIVIVASSSFGYLLAIIVLAIIVGLLSARLPGFGNGLLSSAIAGTIAGGTGALIIAASVAFTISAMSPMRTLLIVPMTGALLGAGFLFFGVYISDRTAFGHPFDDIITFPLWQTGVASVFPACRRSWHDDFEMNGP